MSGPTRYHAEYAWLPGRPVPDADVLIELAGGRFTGITVGVPVVPADAYRLSGLTLPGLANTHSHAFHRALRGRTGAAGGSFWTWRGRMYEVAGRLDPDSYLALARATYAEMALAGVTCVGEFHYLHHGPGGRRYHDPNAMSAALVEAATQAGIRITLLDTCYLTATVDGQPLTGPQLRFGDGDARRWADRAGSFAPTTAQRTGAPTSSTARGTGAPTTSTAQGPGAPTTSTPRGLGAPTTGNVRVGAAIHSVRAVPAEQIPVVVEWADERGEPLHVHLSEQPAENEACLAYHGRTPTGLLADAGALGPRTTAVHATHLTDADRALLGGSGTGACLCPTTERDLADGIGPARPLVDAGCPLSLGSDSHAVLDLFEEVRGVESHERLRTLRRGHFAPAELLHAAAGAGHAALGWTDAGTIAVGARADLVTVRLDSVRTAGVPAAGALGAATAADVTDVLVDGRVVVRGGRHATLDVPSALTDAIGAVVGS